MPEELEDNQWRLEEASAFMAALEGEDKSEISWTRVRRSMGETRSEDTLMAVFFAHRAFLSLPDSEPEGLLAVMADEQNRARPPLKRTRKRKLEARDARRPVPEELIRLRHWSSHSKALSWAKSEWFYSQMDIPRVQDTFESLILTGLGIASDAQLSQAEWSRLRQIVCEVVAGGTRPRRLSRSFLGSERIALVETRFSKRKSMAEFHNSPWQVDPACLFLDERVLAIHPEHSLPFTGKVLTQLFEDLPKEAKYRVIFDEKELGCRVVDDICVSRVKPGGSFFLAVLPPLVDNQADAVHLLESLRVKPEETNPKLAVDLRDLAEMLRLLDLKDQMVSAMSEANDRAATAMKSSSIDDALARFRVLQGELSSVNSRLVRLAVKLHFSCNRADSSSGPRTMEHFSNDFVRLARQQSEYSRIRLTNESLASLVGCIELLTRAFLEVTAPNCDLPRLSEGVDMLPPRLKGNEELKRLLKEIESLSSKR